MMLKRTEFKRTMPTEPKRRTKKCSLKGCRVRFVQLSMLHRGCCPEHAIEIVQQEKARKARKERQEGLERLKRRADYLKETQAAVNAFVRYRDRLDPCISCDRPATWSGQWHASHFRSVGSSPATRFLEVNIHKSCSICNNHLSGNIREYRPRLIAKVGAMAVEALEADQAPRKWTIPELQAIKATYVAKLKALKASHV
jgi:hypothetical protein